MKCKQCRKRIPNAFKLDAVDRNTILAALRFYQQCGMEDPANRSGWLDEIATNSGAEMNMTSVGIDNLCERLNTGD